MRTFRYQSVFAHASYQFCGHIDEYLVSNTRHLGLFIPATRFGNMNHVLRIYEEGALVRERHFASSHNIFLYYFLIFIRHNVELWKFAARQKTRTIVMCGHPVQLFFMGLQRIFHRLEYSYWIGDFFPSRGLVIRAFEAVKRFYHNRVQFRWYLSDAINKVMNGKVVCEPKTKTVAWGIRMRPGCEVDRGNSHRMLFVGLLRDGQGIDRILDFLASAPEYRLSIVGEAAYGFDAEIAKMIAARGLGDRVYFNLSYKF